MQLICSREIVQALPISSTIAHLSYLLLLVGFATALVPPSVDFRQGDMSLPDFQTLQDQDHIESRITAAHVDHYRKHGYAVIDNFFGAASAGAIREEIGTLAVQGRLKPNKVQFSCKGQPCVFTKPNIFEGDMHDASLRSGSPALSALFASDALPLAIASHMPELKLALGTSARTVKVQVNHGLGACFPLHYDNPGRPNRRKVTCLLYLNPEWTAGDGGELEILPFLDAARRIQPLHDRLLLFASDSALHRVLPSAARRHCVTVWLDAEPNAVNTDQDVTLSFSRAQVEDDIAAVAASLRNHPAARSVSRAVYAEEYRESLIDCMRRPTEGGGEGGGEVEGVGAVVAGGEEMLASHEDYLRGVRANAGLSVLVEKLRALKAPPARDGGG